MTKHVHPLPTHQEAEGASLLMKHLGQRYVQYVNRAYRRSGTLSEGQFRSCRAQEAAYVLACQRSLELNPVRAQTVRHPRHYLWSSYRTNAGGKASVLLTRHAQYLALGSTDEARREGYRQLFRSELHPEVVQEIRDATNGNFALGGERFKRQVETMLGRRVSRGQRGRPRKAESLSKPAAATFE
jgi:putative transposase